MRIELFEIWNQEFLKQLSACIRIVIANFGVNVFLFGDSNENLQEIVSDQPVCWYESRYSLDIFTFDCCFG